jgi:hypothetical protein
VCTAKKFALDNSRLKAELHAADRGDIAARARTDNDDVKRFGHVFGI